MACIEKKGRNQISIRSLKNSGSPNMRDKSYISLNNLLNLQIK